VEKMADVQVKLVKSLIGSTKVQIATAHALGLHKIGDSSVQPENPATLGKVNRIAHLIQTSEAKQGGANE
jgi:large subunit ribosomal protein L30